MPVFKNTLSAHRLHIMSGKAESGAASVSTLTENLRSALPVLEAAEIVGLGPILLNYISAENFSDKFLININ
jgi:hypothetical protein